MFTEIMSQFNVFENHIDKSEEGFINWETYIYYHESGKPDSVRPNQIVFRHKTESSWTASNDAHIQLFLDKALKGKQLFNQVNFLDKKAMTETGKKLSGTQLEKAIQVLKFDSVFTDEFAEREATDELVALNKAVNLFGPDLELVLGKS